MQCNLLSLSQQTRTFSFTPYTYYIPIIFFPVSLINLRMISFPFMPNRLKAFRDFPFCFCLCWPLGFRGWRKELGHHSGGICLRFISKWNVHMSGCSQEIGEEGSTHWARESGPTFVILPRTTLVCANLFLNMDTGIPQQSRLPIPVRKVIHKMGIFDLCRNSIRMMGKFKGWIHSK